MSLGLWLVVMSVVETVLLLAHMMEHVLELELVKVKVEKSVVVKGHVLAV